MHSLRKLRGKNVTEEITQREFYTFSHGQSNEGKGTWIDIFRGTNTVSKLEITAKNTFLMSLIFKKRRTAIVIVVMVGQQITGQAFISQYSVVFYKQQRFNNSFELGMIQQALGVLIVVLTTVTADSFGRRRILLIGGTINTIFFGHNGSNGSHWSSIAVRKETYGGMHHAMVLFLPIILGFAAICRSRRSVNTPGCGKTNTLAVSLSVISAFLVSFTAPYLIGADYANLGGKVGFIYGALTALFTVLAYIYVPEMKCRSLEELDVMFHDKVSTRKFRTAIVSSADVYSDPHEHKVVDINVTTIHDPVRFTGSHPSFSPAVHMYLREL